MPWLLAEEARDLFKDNRWTQDGLHKKITAEYDIVSEIFDLAQAAGCRIYYPFAGFDIGPFKIPVCRSTRCSAVAILLVHPSQGLGLQSVLPESQLELERAGAKRFELGLLAGENWWASPTRIPSTRASRRLRSPMIAPIMSREPIDMWRSGRWPLEIKADQPHGEGEETDRHGNNDALHALSRPPGHRSSRIL